MAQSCWRIPLKIMTIVCFLCLALIGAGSFSYYLKEINFVN
ncbi:unnamed protein product [Oikopleura dioica]|uniref:Uncharacterized protein n=1 Tax=Oikopleura dioica TaxID=34765 RepID=E4Y4U0_OIKDI|nr:unnamed protein product [Oikopleura dioica]